MTLSGSNEVWHVSFKNDQAEHGWLEFMHGLCGVDCSICGPNAGWRRVARSLTNGETVLLELLLGSPVPTSVFRDVVAKWKAMRDLGWYEPAPGDRFSPGTWVQAPHPLTDAYYVPVNSIAVFQEALATQFQASSFIGVSFSQLSTVTESVPYWELLVRHGPWDVKLRSDRSVPKCEECGRRLQPVSHAPQKERSFWWSHSKFPGDVLPDADVIRSPLNPGIICSNRFYSCLIESIDVLQLETRRLDVVESTYYAPS